MEINKQYITICHSTNSLHVQVNILVDNSLDRFVDAILRHWDSLSLNMGWAKQWFSQLTLPGFSDCAL